MNICNFSTASFLAFLFFICFINSHEYKNQNHENFLIMKSWNTLLGSNITNESKYRRMTETYSFVTQERIPDQSLDIINNWDPNTEQKFLLKNGTKEIDKSFWPNYMKNISLCPSGHKHYTSTNNKAFSGFIFVLIVTPDYIEDYRNQINTLKLYCFIHRYILRIVDPMPILTKLYNNETKFDMKLSPSIMKVIFEDYYQSYGCKVEWLIFLDIDIFVIDYERSIQSFITYANNHHNVNNIKKCKIIAQDSTSSLNTGFLFFSMTDFSYNWLNYWIIVLKRHTYNNWLFAQGYFQYIYLEYIQTISDKFLPFDCTEQRKMLSFTLTSNLTNYIKLATTHRNDLEKEFTSLYSGNYNIVCSCSNIDYCYLLGKNGLRNLCYVKSLKYLGLEYSYNKSRSFGNVCLLPGISTRDRFNNHEFGNIVFNETKKSFVWKISDTCSLHGLFFYHGKNDSIYSHLYKNFYCAYKKHRHGLEPPLSAFDMNSNFHYNDTGHQDNNNNNNNNNKTEQAYFNNVTNINCHGFRRKIRYFDDENCIQELVSLYETEMNN